MNIIVCSLSDRPTLTDITWSVIESYCKKHGYAFVTRTHSLDVTRHNSWSKIILLKDLLVCTSYDIIVWIDDDILITEACIPLERLLSTFINSDKLIALQEDTHGEPFNAGIMCIKNTPVTNQVLDKIYATCRTENAYYMLWEQTAMKQLYENETWFKPLVHIYPRCTLQGYLNKDFYTDDFLWKKGVFSAHACGVPVKERLQYFNAILQAEKN